MYFKKSVLYHEIVISWDRISLPFFWQVYMFLIHFSGHIMLKYRNVSVVCKWRFFYILYDVLVNPKKLIMPNLCWNLLFLYPIQGCFHQKISFLRKQFILFPVKNNKVWINICTGKHCFGMLLCCYRGHLLHTSASPDWKRYLYCFIDKATTE